MDTSPRVSRTHLSKNMLQKIAHILSKSIRQRRAMMFGVLNKTFENSTHLHILIKVYDYDSLFWFGF